MDTDLLPNIGAILLLLGFPATCVLAFMYNYWTSRLVKRIRKTDPELCRELMKWPGTKLATFRESDEDTEDPIVNLYRARAKRWRRFIIIPALIMFAGLVLVLLTT